MKIELSPTEARVLGVLVEKAQTTPAQYPMTLNSITSGCNQKSNRFPMMNLSEDEVIDALDALRSKSLVREVMLTGSRVAKFKHNSRETLDVSTSELVILAELMMRGPQTIGEIRGRASRMHPLESLEVVKNLLDHMMDREQPLVKEIGAAPGSRAVRFMQLVAPNAHVDDSGAAPPAASSSSPAPSASSPGMETRLAALESEVAALRDEITALRRHVGIHPGAD